MKRQAMLVIVATVMCSAAFGEYDYFRNAQYPVGLRPDVGLDTVEQEGGPDATGYKKRRVQWWPKRGVDVVDVPEGAVYRTWTLDTEKDGLLGEFRFRRKWGTKQPKQFKAHLLGFRGIANDIYCQIGLVMLIGLASKNAILIVEFARELREQGMSIVDAAVNASRERLRPILMTAFAFILGVVPMVVATGAGAASRHSLGTAVFGGMLASTFLSLVLVPVLYVVLERLRERKGKGSKKDGVTSETKTTSMAQGPSKV